MYWALTGCCQLLTNSFSIHGYDFNLDAMTSFEGDTGPYLQYAHARLCSMMRKSGLAEEDLVSANFDLLTERHAIDLIRLLSQYSDVLSNTLKTLEPVTVLSYLFKMTHALSSSYDILKVIGSEPEVKKARMALYAAARQVLHNGMRVLGLSPVQRFVHDSLLIPLSIHPVKDTLSSCPFPTATGFRFELQWLTTVHAGCKCSFQCSVPPHHLRNIHTHDFF